MRNPILLFAHLPATIAKLLKPGDAKALVSENLLLKRYLLIAGRSRNPASWFTFVGRIKVSGYPLCMADGEMGKGDRVKNLGYQIRAIRLHGQDDIRKIP